MRNYRHRYTVFGDGIKAQHNGAGYWNWCPITWRSCGGFIFCKSYRHALRQMARVAGGKGVQIEESPTYAMRVRGNVRRKVVHWRTRPAMFIWKVKSYHYK